MLKVILGSWIFQEVTKSDLGFSKVSKFVKVLLGSLIENVMLTCVVGGVVWRVTHTHQYIYFYVYMYFSHPFICPVASPEVCDVEDMAFDDFFGLFRYTSDNDIGILTRTCS